MTTTTNQASEVNVTVNPDIQVGISNVVDLSPVERALAEMARVVDRGQTQTAAAVSGAAAASLAGAQATGQGLSALAAADQARTAQLSAVVADARSGLLKLGSELDARVSAAGQAFLILAGVGLFIMWRRAG